MDVNYARERLDRVMKREAIGMAVLSKKGGGRLMVPFESFILRGKDLALSMDRRVAHFDVNDLLDVV